MLRAASIILLLGLVGGCSETRINDNPGSVFSPVAPTNPTSPPVTPVNRLFEFRINGNAQSVRVLYSTPNDGVVQVITALPYQASFTSADTSIFLTLDVTPITYPVTIIYPFISAQILVNGIVFRQATSDTFLSSPLEVSGTWRQ